MKNELSIKRTWQDMQTYCKLMLTVILIGSFIILFNGCCDKSDNDEHFALVRSIEMVDPNKKSCTIQFGKGPTRTVIKILFPDTVTFNVGDTLEFVKYKN